MGFMNRERVGIQRKLFGVKQEQQAVSLPSLARVWQTYAETFWTNSVVSFGSSSEREIQVVTNVLSDDSHDRNSVRKLSVCTRSQLNKLQGKITSLSSCGDNTLMTPVSPCKENAGIIGGFCDTMRYLNRVCRVKGSSLSSAVTVPTITPVNTTQQF